MDVLYVHPKGEGQGGPESQFVRIDELDELYVRPEGEGHGWPESIPASRHSLNFRDCHVAFGSQ